MSLVFKRKQIRFIDEGEYYIRIETIDTIEYRCFGEDYESAKIYCITNNIPNSSIKQWRNFDFTDSDTDDIKSDTIHKWEKLVSKMINMENISKAIKEFKSFKFKYENIFTKSEWTGDWNNDDAILLIYAEYCCRDDNEVNECHINYDAKFWGSKRFNEWLDKYNLHFEWHNCCIGYIYFKHW